MATNIENTLRELSEGFDQEDALMAVDVPLDESELIDIDGESATVEYEDDGGAIIDFGSDETERAEVAHGENLADYMEESELKSMASELIGKVGLDENSRRDWERTYIKGLDNLGLKIEERQEPWPGACAATHPLLGESVVRFQAQTISEIFPPQGPVKSTVIGKSTPEKERQANRVQDYMNYVIVDEMTEYRPETEKMLFSLPLAGSAFRKIYFDPAKGRPCSMFVPAEDIVVNYAATDIRDAERITHRMKISDNEVRKRVASGFYRDFNLMPAVAESNQINEKIDDITGRDKVADSDDRRTIYEIHCDYTIDGFDDNGTDVSPPYVITVDKTNSDILSIRRNWMEQDPARNRRQHFVHYEFIPGIGFYGFGLVHLIGGLAQASTSILRQLVDAGTLSNLPGGFKSRDMRTKGENDPIMPGEWRDVDVTSGTIKESIVPLPYKEPSQTLFNLLGMIVEDGRRFASMADLKVADMNQEAPVGTTLAIMERAMKVQTSIQQRIHAGMRHELKMLSDVIKTQTTPVYPYEVDEDARIKADDFDDRVDVIPVSDPNAATMAQRIMQHQAALQLASTAPQNYDMKRMHRNILMSIGYPDVENIVPMEQEIPPMDPISENSILINLGKVSAKQYQDHDAHLRVHKTLLENPDVAGMMQNSQSGPSIRGAIDAHIREHMAMLYRVQIEQELGTPLPPLGEPMPEDVEKRISALAAQAADQLLGKKQAQQEAEKRAAEMDDPIIRQKDRELDIREMDVKRKEIADMSKLEKDNRKMEIERELAMLSIEQRREEAGLEAVAEIAGRGQAAELEGVKIGVQIAEALDANKIAEANSASKRDK